MLTKNVISVIGISISAMFFSHNTFANNQGAINEFDQFMAENKGKVVYVDFWASWCVPCRKSFPWMNVMQKTNNTDGLVILAINLDVQQSLATKFLLETPANFPIIYDSKGVLAKRFKLNGMPSSYIFNREGVLISSHSVF